MVATQDHEYLIANLASIARAVKTEDLALRSLLRGQESEYLRPIDRDTPRGFYSCSDALMFACIKRLEREMGPAQRQELRKVVSTQKSVWQDAHLNGASSGIVLGILQDDHLVLGPEEVLLERCRRLEKRYGPGYTPAMLNVGKVSESLHAELRKIRESNPRDVMGFVVSAKIEEGD